jgi:hypothetical protein
LDEALVVGKGVTSRKLLPTSLLANVFEAIVCAVYLDAGLAKARDFCLRNLYHQVLKVNQNRHPLNYKSILQQHLQKADGRTPNYRVASESGPDHSKVFTVHAQVGKKVLGTGTGKNKKEAEQAAAQQALERLGVAAEGEAVVAGIEAGGIPAAAGAGAFPLPPPPAAAESKVDIENESTALDDVEIAMDLAAFEVPTDKWKSTGARDAESPEK